MIILWEFQPIPTLEKSGNSCFSSLKPYPLVSLIQAKKTQQQPPKQKRKPFHILHRQGPGFSVRIMEVVWVNKTKVVSSLRFLTCLFLLLLGYM